ncbi:MAG: glucosamine-6-phosphate deaminase [Saprospiraceae bacterium]
MKINVVNDANEMGLLAAKAAAITIRKVIEAHGVAHIILATGASQFTVLDNLVHEEGIDWGRVVMFHLDEYVGIPESHPASFRKYLKDRFIDKVSHLKATHLIQTENDAEEECGRIGNIIDSHSIDLALVGIGENGHLAFNDPPADFDTQSPYIVVQLDETCRQQQFGEGWFESMDQVPLKAISMSVHQILKSKEIICSVPDARKALAVKNTLEQAISNLYPASILRTHTNCTLFLDQYSSSMLSKNLIDHFPFRS